MAEPAIRPVIGRHSTSTLGAELDRLRSIGIMRHMVPGEARNQATQLRRGLLELCVLAVLRRGESYAFDIVRVLSEAGELLTSEGTIYPLLARLREQRLASTTWRESASGPPRRYYRLTDAGHRALVDLSGDWMRFRDAVDALIAGSEEATRAD